MAHVTMTTEQIEATLALLGWKWGRVGELPGLYHDGKKWAIEAAYDWSRRGEWTFRSHQYATIMLTEVLTKPEDSRGNVGTPAGPALVAAFYNYMMKGFPLPWNTR